MTVCVEIFSALVWWLQCARGGGFLETGVGEDGSRHWSDNLLPRASSSSLHPPPPVTPISPALGSSAVSTQYFYCGLLFVESHYLRFHTSIYDITIKLSGGERECCTEAQHILYSKIPFGAALSSRNIATCTTRSTMWHMSPPENWIRSLFHKLSPPAAVCQQKS